MLVCGTCRKPSASSVRGEGLDLGGRVVGRLGAALVERSKNLAAACGGFERRLRKFGGSGGLCVTRCGDSRGGGDLLETPRGLLLRRKQTAREI